MKRLKIFLLFSPAWALVLMLYSMIGYVIYQAFKAPTPDSVYWALLGGAVGIFMINVFPMLWDMSNSKP